jgi:hypothetical protein
MAVVKGQSKVDKKTNQTNGPSLKSDAEDVYLQLLLQSLDPDKQSLVIRLFQNMRIKSLLTSLKVVSIVAITLVCALIVSSWMISNNKEFYNIDSHGNVQNAKTSKNVTFYQNQVKSWAIDTITEAFDLHYLNIDKKINYVTSRRFTLSGKKSFGDAMVDIRKQINEKKAIMVVEFAGGDDVYADAKLRNRGSVWKFRKPALLRIQPLNNKPYVLNAMINMTIVRVDEWEQEKGLAVSQINVVEINRNAQK